MFQVGDIVVRSYYYGSPVVGKVVEVLGAYLILEQVAEKHSSVENEPLPKKLRFVIPKGDFFRYKNRFLVIRGGEIQ